MSRGVSPITTVCSRGTGDRGRRRGGGRSPAARPGPRESEPNAPWRGRRSSPDPRPAQLEPRRPARSCRSAAPSVTPARSLSQASTSGMPGTTCRAQIRRAQLGVDSAQHASRTSRRGRRFARPTRRGRAGSAGRSRRRCARPALITRRQSRRIDPVDLLDRASAAPTCAPRVAPESSVPSMSNRTSTPTRLSARTTCPARAAARTPRSGAPPPRHRPPRPSRPGSACSGRGPRPARWRPRRG